MKLEIKLNPNNKDIFLIRLGNGKFRRYQNMSRALEVAKASAAVMVKRLNKQRKTK